MSKGIPHGLRTITPSIRVDGAVEAIELYKQAFGAEESEPRAMDPSGTKVWHGVMRIGDSSFFIGDAAPQMGAKANHSVIYLYLDDVDAAYARALAAGLTSRFPLTDMFWGDRMGIVVDRWGNEWNLATRVKILTPAEMKEAEAEFLATMGKPSQS